MSQSSIPHKLIRGAKYTWRLPEIDETAALHTAAQYNVCAPIMHTLFARGMTSRDVIDSFLFTSLEKDVAHPSLLKDADKAIDRLLHAIEHQEKILIFGDYDVDGITSSALMMQCLLPLGANINFFLPNRVIDGYGLSEKIVQRAAESGYKLIITVDNGTTAFRPIQRANELGVDIIITDHHQPAATMVNGELKTELPAAFAIINPHQPGCQYPFKYFAGVGVTFKFLSLLYERKGLPLPSKAYELLLLGTVADVVPLLGENRFWVRHGLNLVNNYQSLAFRALKNNSKLTREKLSSTDIGFSITPQINALGRLEDPRQGVKFLIGSDEHEVTQVGSILLELNERRKDIERGVLSGIVAEIESGKINIAQERVIIAASAHWPPGVIGLVASRLVGMYGRPAILLHIGADGMAKGSCRSIPEFSILSGLQHCAHLLATFGGHHVAAGLSLKVERLPELKEQMEAYAAQTLAPDDLVQKLSLDARIPLTEVNAKLVSDLEYLQPFGAQNPQPNFYVSQVSLVSGPQLLKDAHVKCSVFADGVIKPLIFFNRPELAETLYHRGNEPFDVAVQVTENTWNGRTNIELLGLDIAF